MASVRVLATIGLLLCALCTVNAIDIKAILENVPADQRIPFLQYYLKRGYELSQQENVESTNQNTKNLSLPDEFAITLYRYIQTMELICFDDGQCIDIGDVGVHPTL